MATFSMDQSSLAINDEIRKTDGANLIKTKFNSSKNRKNQNRTKTYYISGNIVNFTKNIPIKERMIQQ